MTIMISPGTVLRNDPRVNRRFENCPEECARDTRNSVRKLYVEFHFEVCLAHYPGEQALFNRCELGEEIEHL